MSKIAAANHRLGQILLPVFVEKATGDNMAPQLEEQHGGVTSDKNLNDYVDFVGRDLLKFSKRRDFDHAFHVLDSEEIINAFALGNGNVYITKGLLNMLDDEAELAEILGHEVAHVANRHVAKQIEKAVGMGLLLALATGIYESTRDGDIKPKNRELMEKASAAGMSLVVNGFGRAQELESDEDGLKYMVASGYDPRGAVTVFEKFQKLEPENQGLEQFFRSHPMAKQRISDLEARIKSRYPKVTGERHRDRFQAIVNRGMTMQDHDNDVAAANKNEVLYIVGGVLLTGAAVFVGGRALNVW